MKILQLLDEPYDSGLTSSALELARLLKEEGPACGVLCRKNSFAWKKAVENGLEPFGFRGSWLVALPKITRWVRELGWTVLHTHTGSMHTLAWLLKRRLGGGIVIVRTRADAKKARKKMFYQRILKATSVMVFPTRAMREEFLLIYDYPIRKAKVLYPVLPAMERWAEVQGAIEEEGPDRRSPLVASVGRLDQVKGQADLIRAMALMSGRFPALECWVIGREQNVRTSDLKRLAARLGVGSRVHFLGYLEPKELVLAMMKSDIGVIASRGSEVISRACLEWMSLGKPLVAAKVGMIRELIENGRSGLLVEPGSPEEIAYAIGKLLKDPGLARGLGMRAQARYQEHLAPGASLGAHLALYESLREKRDM